MWHLQRDSHCIFLHCYKYIQVLEGLDSADSATCFATTDIVRSSTFRTANQAGAPLPSRHALRIVLTTMAAELAEQQILSSAIGGKWTDCTALYKVFRA